MDQKKSGRLQPEELRGRKIGTVTDFEFAVWAGVHRGNCRPLH
jgi:hypothetical protein